MKKLLVITAVLILATGASAEDANKTTMKPVRLEKIVVSPSRIPEDIISSACSISVADETDFDRTKESTVKEVLRDEVGVDIRQAGAFQGQTSIFMRGGNSNHTLIMVDGLRAYDPISPNGAYNLNNLTLDNVERIEILRGPQSALYGSDAMSGVISIMSKKAEKAYVDASFEGGSFNTFLEKFDFGAAMHGLHYSFAGSRLDTKGVSQAQAKHGCYERDPYDRTSLAGRIDYDITKDFSIGGTIRYIKGHYAYDQGAGADDDNAFGQTYETFITTYGSLRLFDRWQQDLKLGWMENKRINLDDNGPGIDFSRAKYYGKNFQINYQNTFDIVSWDKFVIGYDYNDELGDNYMVYQAFGGRMVVADMPKVFSHENDLYLENRINFNDKLTSTQGMRVMHHSRAGTHETYRVDASYLFDTGTKVRGMVATGFKAPTLYQLFSVANPWFGGGNPNLKPEKSMSYEYGIDQYLANDRIILNCTYFNTLYSNLINAISNPAFTNQYTNIGKARVYGIELSGTICPVKEVKLEAGFTYQKPWDISNDMDLLRRPSHKFYAEFFWQATKKFSFDTRINYNGNMADSGGYKVKEYTVVNMVLNYDLTKNFSMYTKLDNVFNSSYEDVRGFTTSPFAAYGGIKAKF